LKIIIFLQNKGNSHSIPDGHYFILTT